MNVEADKALHRSVLECLEEHPDTARLNWQLYEHMGFLGWFFVIAPHEDFCLAVRLSNIDHHAQVWCESWPPTEKQTYRYDLLGGLEKEWAEDAEPGPPGAPVQVTHFLKRLGQHAKAHETFRTALLTFEEAS